MEMGKAHQGKETDAKCRGTREQLYLQPEAFMEPRMGTVSFFKPMPSQRHLQTHTLASFLLSAQPKAPNSTCG